MANENSTSNSTSGVPPESFGYSVHPKIIEEEEKKVFGIRALGYKPIGTGNYAIDVATGVRPPPPISVAPGKAVNVWGGWTVTNVGDKTIYVHESGSYFVRGSSGRTISSGWSRSHRELIRKLELDAKLSPKEIKTFLKAEMENIQKQIEELKGKFDEKELLKMAGKEFLEYKPPQTSFTQGTAYIPKSATEKIKQKFIDASVGGEATYVQRLLERQRLKKATEAEIISKYGKEQLKDIKTLKELSSKFAELNALLADYSYAATVAEATKIKSEAEKKAIEGIKKIDEKISKLEKVKSTIKPNAKYKIGDKIYSGQEVLKMIDEGITELKNKREEILSWKEEVAKQASEIIEKAEKEKLKAKFQTDVWEYTAQKGLEETESGIKKQIEWAEKTKEEMLYPKFEWVEELKELGTEVAIGAGTGAVMGSIIPGVGTVAGAVTGAITSAGAWAVGEVVEHVTRSPTAGTITKVAASVPIGYAVERGLAKSIFKSTLEMKRTPLGMKIKYKGTPEGYGTVEYTTEDLLNIKFRKPFTGEINWQYVIEQRGTMGVSPHKVAVGAKPTHEAMGEILQVGELPSEVTKLEAARKSELGSFLYWMEKGKYPYEEVVTTRPAYEMVGGSKVKIQKEFAEYRPSKFSEKRLIQIGEKIEKKIPQEMERAFYEDLEYFGKIKGTLPKKGGESAVPIWEGEKYGLQFETREAKQWAFFKWMDTGKYPEWYNIIEKEVVEVPVEVHVTSKGKITPVETQEKKLLDMSREEVKVEKLLSMEDMEVSKIRRDKYIKEIVGKTEIGSIRVSPETQEYVYDFRGLFRRSGITSREEELITKFKTPEMPKKEEKDIVSWLSDIYEKEIKPVGELPGGGGEGSLVTAEVKATTKEAGEEAVEKVIISQVAKEREKGISELRDLIRDMFEKKGPKGIYGGGGAIIELYKPSEKIGPYPQPISRLREFVRTPPKKKEEEWYEETPKISEIEIYAPIEEITPVEVTTPKIEEIQSPQFNYKELEAQEIPEPNLENLTTPPPPPPPPYIPVIGQKGGTPGFILPKIGKKKIKRRESYITAEKIDVFEIMWGKRESKSKKKSRRKKSKSKRRKVRKK